MEKKILICILILKFLIIMELKFKRQLQLEVIYQLNQELIVKTDNYQKV